MGHMDNNKKKYKINTATWLIYYSLFDAFNNFYKYINIYIFRIFIGLNLYKLYL